MSKQGLVVVVLAVCAIVSSAHTQTSTRGEATKESPANAVRLDSSLVLPPGSGFHELNDPFRENTSRPLTSYLAVDSDRFYGIHRVKLSRFQCGLKGAGVGMKLGMIAGAMGMTIGDWDESTGWYIAGAAAVLGALWGGAVKADDPGWHIQLRWEPSEYDE